MNIRFRILTLWILAASATGLYGQADLDLELNDVRFVRPFTIGVTAGGFGPTLLPDDTFEIEEENPTKAAEYFMEGSSARAFYGITTQFTLGNRWAVGIQANLRRMKYAMDINTTTGVDNPNIPGDQRNFVRTEERTEAWFFDVPVMMRYYTVDHLDPGTRAFFEFGGAVRHVTRVRSTIDVQNRMNQVLETLTDPVLPQNNNVIGAVAGFGVQFIDDFGIRTVPEFRFTRWMGQPYEGTAIKTNQNMIEAMISFTF